MGIFYGVSVGPGDPELMTLKSVKILNKCRVIAAPKTKGKNTLALDIASQSVDMSGKIILTPSFAMSTDPEILKSSRQKTAYEIEDFLKQGLDVAMVNLGDVSIYSTFSYIADIIERDGFKTEYIAGVPSFCAAAAAIGKSLTTNGKPLYILPWASAEKFSAYDGTKVIMKPGDLNKVKELFSGRNAYVIENCGLENEKFTPLDEADEIGYFSLVISE